MKRSVLVRDAPARERAIENERRGKQTDKQYRPEAFITRRGALATLALLTTPVLARGEEQSAISLDRDIVVTRGGKSMTIDADALWHALEASKRIPL